jgi:putative isomerase
VALRQVLLEVGSAKDRADALKYEPGCGLNSLSFSGMDG